MQPYRKQQLHSVVTVMQTISLASSADYLPVSSRKQKSAFPPNFVHSMDATHMMMTALKMKKLGLNFASVHDSYWTHACDIPVMSSVRITHALSFFILYLIHSNIILPVETYPCRVQCLREAFVELYSLPLLEDLRESMVVRFPDVNFPPVPQRGNLDIQLVKDSRYFFH